jgi:hypothetical protein
VASLLGGWRTLDTPADIAKTAGMDAAKLWKAGSGGYSIYVVPSLDMVIYKMGGNGSQYDPGLTRLPVTYRYGGSRDQWKPGDPKAVGDSTSRTLEMVVAAAVRK